jgi:CBS domain-containing protein
MVSSQPTVGGVMSTRLLTVGPEAPLEHAARIMEERRVRQLVVMDERQGLRGLLSYRALLRAFVARPETLEGTRVEELLTRDPTTVAADTPLRDAVRLMLDRDISVLPVIDADRRVVGILSEHDVARVLGTALGESRATRPSNTPSAP